MIKLSRYNVYVKGTDAEIYIGIKKCIDLLKTIKIKYKVADNVVKSLQSIFLTA